MSRVSSLLLACVCAALLSASVSAQTLTITGNTTAGPLADGGTTYGMMDLVTLTVTLSGGAGITGESITFTCTDSQNPGVVVGAFSANNRIVTGSPQDTITLSTGEMSASLNWQGVTQTYLPVRCTAIGSTDYLTRSAEFTFYNGVRWAVSVATSPLAAGEQTTATAEVFPVDAVERDGTSVVLDLSCEGLDIVSGPPGLRRRLLATSYQQTLTSGSNKATWTVIGPAVPQPTLACSWTRTGGLASTPSLQRAVVDMTLPTVTWDNSFPLTVTIGEPIDVTLTLSQACTGSLILQSTCQSNQNPATDFVLPNFSFQDEETKTFTIPAGIFTTPMNAVQCRVWFASGDAFFTHLSSTTFQPFTHAFSIVAAAESSTGEEQSDSTAGGQQSDSTASQQQTSTASQQSVSSSASQQSASSTATVASSGPNGSGASSSTGASRPCIPGLTCAAANAHASWTILALVAAAVLGAFRQ